MEMAIGELPIWGTPPPPPVYTPYQVQIPTGLIEFKTGSLTINPPKIGEPMPSSNPGTVTVADGGSSDPITVTPGGENDALISVGDDSMTTFCITNGNKAAVFDAINRALNYKSN